MMESFATKTRAGVVFFLMLLTSNSNNIIISVHGAINRAGCVPIHNTNRCTALMDRYKGLGCVASCVRACAWRATCIQ